MENVYSYGMKKADNTIFEGEKNGIKYTIVKIELPEADEESKKD